MRRSFLIALLILCSVCILNTSCSNKSKTNWELSFHSNYLSEECFAFFDDPLQSKTGTLTFENTNDFPICLYIYKGFLYDNVEQKIKIMPKQKLKYQVNKDNIYYVGIKVFDSLDAFTEIGLSITTD